MTSRVTVRSATLDDIPAAARVRAAAMEHAIITPEGMRAGMSQWSPESVLLLLAAEIDDQLIGWCVARRIAGADGTDTGFFDVVVHPDHQHQGVGMRLAVAGLDRLDAAGIDLVRTFSIGGPAALAMGERLGFVASDIVEISAVDPRTVPLVPVPRGVMIRPFGQIDDPRPIYELHDEARRDIPGANGLTLRTYDEWRAHFWRTVFADDEASLVAYVGDELAALSILRVDRPSHRAKNDLTATRRAYRGRGLARLIKSQSLHRAAAAGVRMAFTDNHEDNAPMLAVNRRLGYHLVAREIAWTRRRPGA